MKKIIHTNKIIVGRTIITLKELYIHLPLPFSRLRVFDPNDSEIVSKSKSSFSTGPAKVSQEWLLYNQEIPGTFLCICISGSLLGPNLELDTYVDATEPFPDLQDQRRMMPSYSCRLYDYFPRFR